ncbi:hypothetical protein [Acinetobacter guerrae]|uniref:hypothetical protein n=1 Tax=Acinetobacter guerrae TaxID=1843371 RepID=UPI00125F5DC4|nr:hypothetical protein [Acinetobacter guerrae]
MSLIKPILIVLSISILSLIGYKIWQPSQAQYEDYRALLCLVIQKDDLIEKDQIFTEMEKVQKHSYPDYALHKPTFKARFARKVFSQLQGLKQVDQQQARKSLKDCENLLSW